MIKNLIGKFRAFASRYSFVFPLILLVETLIAYGMLGLMCGFYWDDWPPVMIAHLTTAGKFWAAYGDRPFSAWIYTVMFPLLQNAAWAWQLAAILLRWLGIVFLYFALENIFPRLRSIFQWSALIAIVAPLFQYQNVSVAFSQHFLTFAIYALSLLLLVKSVQHPRHFWWLYGLSLVLAALHMFMMEYFVGLEILRPFVVYFSLKKFRQENHFWRKFILLFTPFLLVLGGYLFYRMEVFPQVSNLGEDFSNQNFLFLSFLSAPKETLGQLVSMVLADLRFSFASAWLDRLWPATLQLTSATFWLSLLLGVIAALLAYATFGLDSDDDKFTLSNRSFWWNFAFAIGLFICGTAPVWVTLRQISRGKYSERFALAAIPAIVFLIVSLVAWLGKSKRVKNALLAVLVALSISYQIQNSNLARKDYQKQQQIYAQLKWRVPELTAGTSIYAPGIFSNYEADYSYSFAFNLLYGKQFSTSLDYWFFTPRDYSAGDLLYDPQMTVTGTLKGETFIGRASNMIAVSQNDSGCLLVLDPIYAAASPSVQPGDYSQYGDLTKFSRIQNSTDESLPQAMGKVSTNTWCYYFEKADLAKQMQDWSKVLSLYAEAEQKGFSPDNGLEYVPLITAQIESGQVSQALKTTVQAHELTAKTDPALCTLWNASLISHPEFTSADTKTTLELLQCSN